MKQDIDNLHKQVQAGQREQKNMEHRHSSEINKIDRSYQQKITKYDNRLKRIDTYFPDIKELLPIAEQSKYSEFKCNTPLTSPIKVRKTATNQKVMRYGTFVAFHSLFLYRVLTR